MFFLPCLGYCLNETCDQFSGDCLKCEPGHYGNNCYHGCGNCLGGTCNQTTGTGEGIYKYPFVISSTIRHFLGLFFL